MFPKPTNLRPDVARLIEAGYEVTIEHDHLVMRGVPYVNVNGHVLRGVLVSTLPGSLSVEAPPDSHQVWFAGEYPCDATGKRMEYIIASAQHYLIGGALAVDFHFSSKPRSGAYAGHYEKMVTYATILESQAAAIEPGVTARTGRVVASPDDSPFEYFDNASGRAGIAGLTAKLRKRSVAILGLGGTGSYVLDFLAKAPIVNIHLIDGDIFEQHNAFRAPGAAPAESIREHKPKVEYFAQVYSRIHRGIVAHHAYVTEQTIDLLDGHEMVFICIDNSEAKAIIVAALEANGTPFIDVGMGVDEVDGGLTGQLRTTLSTPANRNHVHERGRIPMTAGRGNDLYARNIQVCELNAMNACLAVIRWKRQCGFYKDTEHEHFSLFSIDGNHLLNEDAA
ncbi:ThiF family adenylyltransferase [Devosia neptuniae]|uniref:ThiF family adenylyltransferase n=1 Tax=Devosia neptuniae TaxID=191302 RepID=UPI0022AE6842|nr:ThiF family adenylyltransferase [Devosia neptuniae]MCZ4348073.1 ThiF family adenylyltransferase [Devosia neptuniae]